MKWLQMTCGYNLQVWLTDITDSWKKFLKMPNGQIVSELKPDKILACKIQLANLTSQKLYEIESCEKLWKIETFWKLKFIEILEYCWCYCRHWIHCWGFCENGFFF